VTDLAEIGFKPWITEPNIYPRITNAEYHADPVVDGSVSSTVVRLMTPPKGAPALARHYLDQGREPKGHYDLGSAFHADLLGIGAEIVEVKAKSWQTKCAQEERDAARAAGQTPLLTAEVEAIRAMVEAARVHEITGPLFEPGMFTAEFVLVWRDPETRLMCRAMIDGVPHYDRRMLLVDLKTTGGDSDPDSLSQAIARFKYHQQFAFYEAGARILGLAEEIVPFIVYISTKPPHIITARPVGARSLDWGHRQNRAALHQYARCLETGRWPGYDDPRNHAELRPIEIPRWAEYAFERADQAGLYDPPEELY
jgi:PDDEXK-like domain of unknown function (DUF3799)